MINIPFVLNVDWWLQVAFHCRRKLHFIVCALPDGRDTKYW